MEHLNNDSDEQNFDTPDSGSQTSYSDFSNSDSQHVNESPTNFSSTPEGEIGKRPRTPYRKDSTSYGDSGQPREYQRREHDNPRNPGYYPPRQDYYDNRNDSRSDNRYDNRNDNRSDSRSDNRYDNRNDNRNNYSNRPSGYSDNRYGSRDNDRREYQPRPPYRAPDQYRPNNYGDSRPPREYQPRPPYRAPDQYRPNNYGDSRPPREYQPRPPYRAPEGAPRQNYDRPPNTYSRDNVENRQSYEGRPQYTPRPNYGDRPQYDRRYTRDDAPQRPPYQNRSENEGSRYGGERIMRSRNHNPDSRYSNDYQGRDDYRQNYENRPITLVKAISKCDYGSPRICLRAIREGLVAVNGEIVTNPNARVRINYDMFEIKGIPVNQKLDKMYIAIHKGRHFAGSNEQNSPTIYRLMRQKTGWFAPLGCLEIASSGMLLFTNDIDCKRTYGIELQNIAKTYRIKVHRPLQSIEEVDRILDFVRTQTEEHVSVVLERANTRNCWLRIQARTSTPKDLRTALKEYGLETLSFERTTLGHLSTKDFHPGSWRRLDAAEIEKLIAESNETIEPYIVPDDYKVVPPASPVQKSDAPNKAAWRIIHRTWCEELRKQM